MRFSLVSVALFCIITWISLAGAVPRLGTNCCESWSTTKVPVQKVMNYTIQSGGICPITAVKFLTIKGKTICSDPDSPWAQRAMRKVDRETKAHQETPSEEDGSADITPASTDASQKTKKNRTGRKGKGKRCKGGKKGQKKCV